MINKEEIATSLVRTLKSQGHQAYFAGGCVRDMVRGITPKDYDIATSATPDQVQALFPKTIPVGAQFGVILVLEQETTFEVATFRTEGSYKDGRRPDGVTFSTLEEDAARRDFTVNGLYYDVDKKEIIDRVGGRKDIEKKTIRAIGDPNKRFLEDHLRVMRAVRFSAQLGFILEAETKRAVVDHASTVRRVSQERIRDEWTKTLTSPQPALGIRLMDEVGLLKIVMPEMETLKGVEQPLEYHPEGDVYIHTLMLMDKLSNAPIELAMGALLHDIAKPQTFVRAADRIRFHGHDKLGAEMAKAICRRMTYSNQQTEIISALVSEHLKFKDVFQMKVSTLKRFLYMEHFNLHMELHRIDCLSSHGKLDAYEFCKQKLAEFSKDPPAPSKLVTGADLMESGYLPGPEFAKILRAVEDAVLEGTVKTKEEGISLVLKSFPLKNKHSKQSPTQASEPKGKKPKGKEEK